MVSGRHQWAPDTDTRRGSEWRNLPYPTASPSGQGSRDFAGEAL